MTDRHYPCIHCGEPEYCMVYGCAAERADKVEAEIYAGIKPGTIESGNRTIRPPDTT